jgi:tetratricopeptide (TPR) repeat protein
MNHLASPKVFIVLFFLTIAAWGTPSLRHVIWRNLGYAKLNFKLSEQTGWFPGEAESYLTKAHDISPSNLSNVRGLGMLLLHNRRLGEVVELWQTMPLLVEESLTYCLRAHTRNNLGLAWCQVAVELNPHTADAWYLLGIAYNRDDSWLQALEAYSKAGALENLTVSGRSSPHLKSGIIYQWALQEHNMALAAYDRAIMANSFAQQNEAAEAYYRRGETRLWLGHASEQFVDDFKTAVILDPTHVQARVMLAATQYKLNNDLAQAEAELYLALRVDPNSVSAHLHLGDIYTMANMPEHATKMYEVAITLAPEMRNAIIERAKNLRAD